LTASTSTEEHTTFDSGTEQLALTPSDGQAFAGSDADTERLALTASSVDTAQFVDANTKSVALTPSSTDQAQDVEQATENFALNPSSSDILGAVDANTERLALSASATESQEGSDANTESLSLSPTSSDILAAEESASELFALVPSDSQNFQGTDADTVKTTFGISGTDQVVFVDSGTEPFKLTPSGVDNYTPGTGGPSPTLDESTETLLLSPSGVESSARATTSGCLNGSGSPAGDANLRLDQVDAGDHLGHGMLDLNAGVDLDEIEVVALIDDELDRAGVGVADFSDQPHGRFAHREAFFLRQAWGGALFDQFLVPPLRAALALEEVADVAVMIGDDLDFDVPRAIDVALQIDPGVAERGLGFGAGLLQRGL
jgi:hypothetical protein